MLNVSRESIKRAATVRDKGTADLVSAVESGAIPAPIREAAPKFY
jgi:hypothetical protein